MFLKILGAKLKELGVDDATVKKQLAMFERYLNSLDENELASALDDVDQIDVIAENICDLIKKRARRPAQTDAESSEAALSAVTEAAAEAADDTAEDAVEKAVEDDDLTPITFPRTPDAGENAESQGENAPVQGSKPVRGEAQTQGDEDRTREYDIVRNPSSDANYDPLEIQAREVTDEPAEDAPTRTINAVGRADIEVIKTDEKNGDQNAPPSVSFDEYDDFPENVPGSPLFWVLFIVTLPITGALLLALIAVFCSLFAALSVLIVALIAVLVCDIAAGTALSLVGIIYGITCTVSVLSEGLFEIGFGVLIGGAAMFAGILIYNLAVRLLPFAIKKLSVLMSFTMSKIKELFYYLKKESSVK